MNNSPLLGLRFLTTSLSPWIIFTHFIANIPTTNQVKLSLQNQNSHSHASFLERSKFALNQAQQYRHLVATSDIHFSFYLWSVGLNFYINEEACLWFQSCTTIFIFCRVMLYLMRMESEKQTDSLYISFVTVKYYMYTV